MFPKLGSHHRLPKAQGRAARAQTQEEEDPDPGGSGRGMFWQVPVTSLPRNIVRLNGETFFDRNESVSYP